MSKVKVFECRHETVSVNSSVLACNLCGTILNPIWVIEKLIKQRDEARAERDVLLDEINEWRRFAVEYLMEAGE